MTRAQRQLERAANRAARRARKAPHGRKIELRLLAKLARTEALKGWIAEQAGTAVKDSA